MTSLGGYVAGWALLAAVVLPCGWLAVEARRWLLPGWAGAWARLAECVVGATAILLVAEAPASFAALDRLGLIAAGAIAAAGAALIRRAPRRAAAPTRSVEPPVDRWAAAGAVIAVGAVVAQWLAWTAQAYRIGMTAYDALFYHSPIAARFAQTHDFTRLHSIVPGEAVAFYPATTEAWHAIGIVAFRSDLASPALNLLALIVMLLGAWCLGRRMGGGPAAVAAVALVAALPYMAVSQPGSSFNDAPALAAVIAAVALFSRAADEGAAGLVGALAAGLAIGIKISFIAPAVALAFAFVWLVPRHRRRSTGVGWVGAMIAAGGYWYVRNLLRVGNPVPGAGIGLPAPSLPVDAQYGARLATSLDLSQHGWTAVYHPGLSEYFGPAWPVIAVAVVAALLLGLTGSRWHRLMAGVLALSLVAYTFTPVSGDPTFFRFNLRYTIAVQGLAVLAVATHPWFRGRVAQRLLTLAALATMFATFFRLHRHDPFSLDGWPSQRAAGIALAVAIVALVVAVALLARLRTRLPTTYIAAVAAVCGVIVGGRGVADRYERDRYRHIPGELAAAWAWAQGVTHARIGVVGLYQQYPFVGPHDDNVVQYVGIETPHHGLARAGSCAAWRGAVNAGRYQYIVTSRDGILPPLGDPPEAAWTFDPAAHRILEVGSTSVFAITGRLDPARC